MWNMARQWERLLFKYLDYGIQASNNMTADHQQFEFACQMQTVG